MTAVTHLPARPRVPLARGAVPLTAARLLRIELRRNAMPWMLPIVAGLFWFDSYRPSAAMPALWVIRTFWSLGQGRTIVDFGPFVAGAAAWMGSRDGRRRMADLATTAARSRWAAQLATWAATAIWAVGGYLVFIGVMFAVYAQQGIQGDPPWWWVAVGASAVGAFTAAGFAVGAFYPSRFAAPLAAFGGFLALTMSSQASFSHTSGWALILPTNSNGNFQADSGMLYRWLPDLPLARTMFLAGIMVAAIGLLGLPKSAGGPRLRGLAVLVALGGVAVTGTAVGLATTARLGPHGLSIPALHDAANDQPIRYTPVCGHAVTLPVCINPAYRFELSDVTAALAPVAGEVAGLPGAPARASQVGAAYDARGGEAGQAMTISGDPPTLNMPLGALAAPGAFDWTTTDLTIQLKVLFVHAFVGAGNGPGSTAQLAVQAALLQDAGMPIAVQRNLSFLFGSLPRGDSLHAVARRFAALPASARRAWLAAHLNALRSGRLTLAQVP